MESKNKIIPGTTTHLKIAWKNYYISFPRLNDLRISKNINEDNQAPVFNMGLVMHQKQPMERAYMQQAWIHKVKVTLN